MKSTIKFPHGAAAVVEPSLTGDCLFLSLDMPTNGRHSLAFSHDQVSALIFGLEQALDTMEARKHAARRAAVYGLARHLDTTGEAHA